MPTSIDDRLHQQKSNISPITQPANSAASPRRYQTNELSFLRPAGFLDQTFHVLSQTDTGPSPFSIVIGRSRISNGEALEILARRLLHEMQDRLSEFELLLFQEGTVDGIAGRAIEYRWQQQGNPIQQIQILFLHQNEQDEPLLIQITGTSNNPQGMTDEERLRFRQFVSSVQLRSESPT